MAKKVRIEPRHRELLKDITEAVRKGKLSMYQIMKDLNYSEHYAKSSTRLKETESWKALMAEQLPDDKLMKTLNKLIEHKEWRANDAGLTHAFKLKSRYGPEKHEHEITERRSVDEIEADIARTIGEVTEALSGKRRSDRKE